MSTSSLLDILEAKLRWFGHGQSRDREYISSMMLRLERPGRRSGGRAEKRFMDAVKEGMKLVGVKDEHGRRGLRRRHVIG